ncbi:hypothetical protein BKA83DRAFT_4288758 [Pisolithus microcarpus]|nr:hypothetical protein BKA83DRAFT_4288758 [Pisolithus microcarpus]
MDISCSGCLCVALRLSKVWGTAKGATHKLLESFTAHIIQCSVQYGNFQSAIWTRWRMSASVASGRGSPQFCQVAGGRSSRKIPVTSSRRIGWAGSSQTPLDTRRHTPAFPTSFFTNVWHWATGESCRCSVSSECLGSLGRIRSIGRLDRTRY